MKNGSGKTVLKCICFLTLREILGRKVDRKETDFQNLWNDHETGFLPNLSGRIKSHLRGTIKKEIETAMKSRLIFFQKPVKFSLGMRAPGSPSNQEIRNYHSDEPNG